MSATSISVEWVEEMKGYISFSAPPAQTKRLLLKPNGGERCSFRLKADISDIYSFVHDPGGEVPVTGYVDCPPFGGQCVIEKGMVNLLVNVIPHRRKIKDMRYRLFFRATDGCEFTLAGAKYVDNDGVLRIWRDTTTLFTNIFQGCVQQKDESRAIPVAHGILYLSFLEFTRMMISFRSNAPTLPSRFLSISRFFTFFSGKLLEVYGPGQER